MMENHNNDEPLMKTSSSSKNHTETTSSSTNHDHDHQGPTFLDEFNFYLAEFLLGSKTLVDFGIGMEDNNDAAIDELCYLYWRSEMIADQSKILDRRRRSAEQDDDDSQKKDDDGSSSSDDNTLVFMDITFHVKRFLDCDEQYHNNPKRFEITSQFGCLLFNIYKNDKESTCSSSSPSGEYVTSTILTITQLEQHAQSAGIDLYSGKPKEIAELMANGLQHRSQAMPSKRIVRVTKGDAGGGSGRCGGRNTLGLSLYYGEVDSYGILNLDIEKSTSQFDTQGMNLLLRCCNFRGRKEDDNNIKQQKGGGKDHGTMVEEDSSSFDVWRERVSGHLLMLEQHQRTLKQLRQQLDDKDGGKKAASILSSPTVQQQQQKKKSKRHHKIARPGRIANKRRKPSKLSFVKSGTTKS